MSMEQDASTPAGSVRKEVAAWLAEQLHDVAQLAQTEEDLRVAAEDKLRQALDRVGITTTASYERTYADHAGRSDAVYGRVVIEYEAVGALATKGGVTHAAEQLERYLRAEADQARDFDALKRVVGVGLDGHRIFFLRFRGAVSEHEPELYVAPGQGILPLEGDPALSGNLTPVLDGPYTVSADSIQTFLLYLQAASRSRLTAEGLAKQFGPSGPCAKMVVKTLIELLEQHADDVKVQTFFDEWDRLFGIVYGVDLDKVNHHLPVLREAYDLPEHSTFKRMLFAVHTYYALLMKLLAAELISKQRESLIDSYLDNLPSADDEKLRRAVERIESGELFAQFSVQNFLEADFFGWYLTVWNGDVAEAIRSIVRLLVTFEPASGVLDPRPTQDLLKRLYQYLVPRQIRHDLGEFYTPNWLADFTIDETGYNADIDARVLDPACGSGTFLISVINRLRDKHSEENRNQAKLAQAILRNVVGFELNPLAVIAARTNYLLALGPLARLVAPLEIPVYLCDSILAPTMTDLGLLGETYELPTSAMVFRIPREVVDEGKLASVTGLLDRCLQGSYSTEEFRQLAARELPPGIDELIFDEVVRLYASLLELMLAGRDGIWVRIVRNAFAPLTSGLFDYILGNPPWVNWQSLAQDYRGATLKFWTEYGLFSLTGHAARLGGGKKDLAALMTYRAIDAYLRSGGRLGFVITNSLFKSKGAGDGFRRFQIGSGAYLKVVVVHDLTAFQPFELATTQASVLVISKGAKTSYPVKYVKWTRKAGGPRLRFTSSLGDFRAAAKAQEFAAAPVDAGRPRSPWLTAPELVDQALRPILGKSEYRAFAGVSTWANGIYWLEIIERAPQGLLRVRNMAEEAKEHDVEQKTALIEPRHVYPLVRSRDIIRWNAKPSTYILVPQDPQTRTGIAESTLRIAAPRTYSYLKAFEGQLSVRSGMIKYFDSEKDAFYSIYNVSHGTFASLKVMWRQMVPQVRAAVVSPIEDQYLGEISPVTQHVVSEIAATSVDEAHYICAMLNSSIVTCISASYSTGKSFGTPSMLDHVPIPRFSAEMANHVALAKLSLEAHRLVSEGEAVEDIEDKVDTLAAEVFGIAQSDLPALQAEARRIGRVHTDLRLPLEE